MSIDHLPLRDFEPVSSHQAQAFVAGKPCRFFKMTLGNKSSLVASLALATVLLWGYRPLLAFNPSQIKILSDPNLDVIYHTLAHFNLPGDPFNLFSEDYVRRMDQAKRDLEVGETRLDREAAALERRYRRRPRLRFLIRAPFLADDLSSFKQALALIDYDFRTRTVPVGPEGRRRKEPLMFGNSRRLIPVFRNHFQAPQEREFAKQFAGCLEEELSRFYMLYREARTEWDQQGVEWFTSFWKSRGMNILEPWASRSGVTQFKVFLTPVMKGRGLGVPVEQGGEVLFHVLTPLPESRREAMHSFFVVLHETARRSTDALAVFPGSSIPSNRDSMESGVRKNAALVAGHLYLKARFPKVHRAYLSFLLKTPIGKVSEVETLEPLFARRFPLNSASRKRVEAFVSRLP